MAENTPVSRLMLGNTTAELAAMRGKPKQIVIDTDKNTAVVMTGAKLGGFPLAKEERKIKAGSANVQINGGSEADLAADITITVLPGTVPTGIELKENPAPDMQGLYLVINYTDAQGVTQAYAIDMGLLSDVYTAGNGITIENRTVSVNDTQLPKWGAVVDGPLPDDYDDSSLAIGATFAYDCDKPPSDAVYLNGNFNTREIIEESGEWEAPVTGIYRITLINGGDGAWIDSILQFVRGGTSGKWMVAYVKLHKGQKVDVVIGAKGIGTASADEYAAIRLGGVTSFGELTPVDENGMSGTCENVESVTNARGIGGGFGGGWDIVESCNATYYGAGGGGRLTRSTGNNYEIAALGDGFQGCVIVEYDDPAKDTNISVDTATAATLADLQSQIAALIARVQELENNE